VPLKSQKADESNVPAMVNGHAWKPGFSSPMNKPISGQKNPPSPQKV